ncbi:MAG: hypothetical protein H0X44_05190 [Acidobacteria bacterium]|nr:hypothetical protein [Acidobacteriota bacterium]
MLAAAALIVESLISRRNERRLRAQGAVEPSDDVWRVMALTYPAAFAAMFAEGWLRGGPAPRVFVIGLVIWGLAKLLKAWAIGSLGARWSFRVLVLPGAPLVTRGPYQWMRHPNYVAVAGELAGAGVMMAAPVAGVVFTMLFIEIMRRRVRVEERMLGIGRA